jgi:serine/threonine-protein kinase
MSGEFTGKLIADKFRAETPLASAGLGELYRGTNTLLEKPVAISLMPADLATDEVIAARFFSEAKSAAKVNHPNILNLTDFGTDPSGTAYAVYEAANGETLSEALKREGQLPVAMALEIATQAGSALSAAHNAGVVHGNLSPDHILAASSERLGSVTTKLFGFATPNALEEDLSGDPEDSARFSYLAPEQCQGSDAPDHRGDIYSLGCIVYEMLSGSKPFVGSTPTEVMMKQIEEPAAPLSAYRQDVPPAIEPAVIKAMSKDPDSRYQSVDEFISDLSGANSVPATAAAAAAVGAGNNNIWKTAFVVLTGVSLLTVAMIYFTYSRQTDPTTVAQPDANGMPVQPINPATGVDEQNLSNLPPDYTSLGSNSNTGVMQLDGTYPSVPGGGGENNPWLNGNNPPTGGPPIQQGGQVIQVPNGQSQFSPPEGCINAVWDPQRYGWLCDMPGTPPTRPTPTPRPTASPAANANTGGTPAATPARPTPVPSRSPAPAANKPDEKNDPLD